MKKYVKMMAFIALTALAMTVFCSCDPDWHEGRRPTDQPGTKWVCEEYDMSFEVDENGLVKNGVLKTEGGDVCFDFLWAVGTTHVTVYDATTVKEFDQNMEYDFLFDGFCEFGRKSFEINVEHDPSGYFPNGCTLHFERVDE